MGGLYPNISENRFPEFLHYGRKNAHTYPLYSLCNSVGGYDEYDATSSILSGLNFNAQHPSHAVFKAAAQCRQWPRDG